jgi:hypothetical protein
MNKYLESKTLYYKLKGGYGDKTILTDIGLKENLVPLLEYFINHPDIPVIKDEIKNIMVSNPINYKELIRIIKPKEGSIFSDPIYYADKNYGEMLKLYIKYDTDTDYSSHMSKLAGIIVESNFTILILKQSISPILLFQHNVSINTIDFLKSCFPMFIKTLELIKRDYNEKYGYYNNYLVGDYNIKIDRGVISEYKFVPYLIMYQTTNKHINDIIYYIQNTLNNIYNKKNTIYDYLEDMTIDSDIRVILNKIIDYRDIKIEGVNNIPDIPIIAPNDLGCGKCTFTNYDDTKTYTSNNPDGMLDVISYVLFAPSDNHLTATIQSHLDRMDEFNDLIAMNIVENMSPYDNKYVKGILNLGLETDAVYNSNGCAWTIRLYYDDSLLQENNKILYEPILKWLNGKKNFHLIKFNFDEQKIHGIHNKLFGALIRIFPLFDSNVKTVAFRDIDSIPLIKDIKLLEDFKKTDKIIHVYDLYKDKDTPEWVTCPLHILKNKYNFKFDNKYKFPLGLTAINNIGDNKFTYKNSQNIFNIIEKEEKFIDKINKIKYIEQRKNDDFSNNYEISGDINNSIKSNYISQHIPISSCLYNIHDYYDRQEIPQYSLWNFGTDEALFNLMIYTQIDISDKTVYATDLYELNIMKPTLENKSYRIKIGDQIIQIPEKEYMKYAYRTDQREFIFYITSMIISESSNPYKLFQKEIMPYNK